MLKFSMNPHPTQFRSLTDANNRLRLSMKMNPNRKTQPKHENQHNTQQHGSIKIIDHHPAGFFSCCSVKLETIAKHVNLHNSFPKNIDGTGLFKMYKTPEQMNQDITHVFFKHPSECELPEPISNVNYNNTHQYLPYSQLDYQNITPVVKKFFEPSADINEIMKHFENKYGIDPGNCIAVYYRGTDKITETALDSFDSYYAKLNELLSQHSDNHGCKILLQSDSAQFFDYMKDKFRDSTHSSNLVIIDEIAPSSTTAGTHNERNQQTNHSDIKHLFAVVLNISKCKHIICSSGNVSQWMMLYRGNAVNVHQSLNLKWLEHPLSLLGE
jgi:hypothetical protein